MAKAVSGLTSRYTLEDTRIAVLDLKEAGYLWEGSIPGHVAAECALFVEFDAKFMTFDPTSDACVLANRMANGDAAARSTPELADELGWEPRRMNSAICYLLRSGVIEARHALASAPWRAVHLIRTDRTLRFARNNAWLRYWSRMQVNGQTKAARSNEHLGKILEFSSGKLAMSLLSALLKPVATIAVILLLIRFGMPELVKYVSPELAAQKPGIIGPR